MAWPSSSLATPSVAMNESGRPLVFLTNTTALPALTICALYKSRWHIATYVLIAVGLPTNADQLILFDF